MPRYSVGAGSKLLVKASSSIHDTTTTWDGVTGEVDADPDTLATAGAKATFTVDMTRFDAGDWLKNRKLKKDFDLEGNPRATFELTAVKDVVRDGAQFTASAEGVLRWRGKEVPLVIAGRGTLDDRGLAATGTFDLDIRKLGMAAPRFLMFKMEDQVRVEVTLQGRIP
ncbi:MAG: YceI family protein [Kofleriaceae bacterium]|nr:YceI family protein [Myxococcales bacterium]MCB9562135.1 YceI family protein [Kofleriaceae bacterium]